MLNSQQQHCGLVRPVFICSINVTDGVSVLSTFFFVLQNKWILLRIEYTLTHIKLESNGFNGVLFVGTTQVYFTSILYKRNKNNDHTHPERELYLRGVLGCAQPSLERIQVFNY